MSNAIEVAHLTRIYDADGGTSPVRAVDGIEFTVREGEIFGFLRPGLTRPTAGQARVLGFDLGREVTQIKKHVGVVPERSNLYDELSAFDNLMFSMQFYGVPWRPRVAGGGSYSAVDLCC